MGLFVTFEGVEGAGKTTQIRMLKARLEEEIEKRTIPRHPVVQTKEPGEGILGAEIRKLVLHPPEGAHIKAWTEAFLMLADRAQHVRECIKPALSQQAYVLCDRYADCTIAYQGHGRRLWVPLLKEMNDVAVQYAWPHVTILLDADPSVTLIRADDRNRMEGEPLDFHQRVRKGYLTLQRSNPQRIVRVKADDTIGGIHGEIWDVVYSKIVTGKLPWEDGGTLEQKE